MTHKVSMKPLAFAFGAVLATTLSASSAVNATGNPFELTQLSSGYMVADAAEGKCGGNKAKTSTEGKCGASKNGDKAGKEGKCGEGKCGANKAKSKTEAEGKCGGSKDNNKAAKEGKCGGNK